MAGTVDTENKTILVAARPNEETWDRTPEVTEDVSGIGWIEEEGETVGGSKDKRLAAGEAWEGKESRSVPAGKWLLRKAKAVARVVAQAKGVRRYGT